MALPLEEFTNALKKSIIDMEGVPLRSEFYLTNVETDEEINFCLTPEKISVKTGSNFRSYSIVEIGEIRIPKGERLTEISWRGILPHAQIMLYPFIVRSTWENPQELLKVFKRWRETNAKLKLLVTQTPLNLEVYLKSFDWEASGGMGDIKYSIDLIAAKELKFMTVEEADVARAEAEQNQQDALNERLSKKSRTAAILDGIDNVWSLVKILTGKGTLADIERVLSQNGKTIDDIVDGDPTKIVIWG